MATAFKEKIIRICPECGKEREFLPWQLKRRQRFCSRECQYKSEEVHKKISKSNKVALLNYYKNGGKNYRKGIKSYFIPSSAFKKGHIPWDKGKERQEMQEEKHWNWEGDEVGYSGLHRWVYRQLGAPTQCEYCNKSNLVGQQIHWANKDHSYKRNLIDWIRLCRTCHKEYDTQLKVNPETYATA